MIIYSITEARKNWAEILDLIELKKETVYISRHGRLIAKIVPYENFDINKKNEPLWDDHL